MQDVMLARADFESDDFGPQLLSVKARVRGNVSQLTTCMVGAVITDVDRRLVVTPRGLLDGLEPAEYYTRTVGALRGLGAWALDAVRIHESRRERWAPRGFGVLARALRSSNPGAVLARAAATGEADPLTDPDARLFVGLRPGG